VGGGMICDELKEAGHNVVGIDISQASCEYVGKKIGVRVIEGDLEKPLIFEKESFDLIIVADLLEHLTNERQFLNEARRCLKPDASIIITVPAYMHMWSSWDIRLEHKRRYSLNYLKNELVEMGFSIKKISYFHALLYPFVYVYRKILRLPKGRNSKKSDFAVLPNRAVSGFFMGYYAVERSLLNFVDLPFGLSIFAVGIKHV